jgi:hypothetical protein
MLRLLWSSSSSSSAVVGSKIPGLGSGCVGGRVEMQISDVIIVRDSSHHRLSPHPGDYGGSEAIYILQRVRAAVHDMEDEG